MVELAKYVAPPNTIQGVDISPGMLVIARQTLDNARVTNVELSEGSAAELHFPDNTFDVLYNAYMLDLIPLADMPRIVNEFKRVLKPGGRLILLNMSKRDAQITTWRERLYPLLPPKLALYVIGGCRPVLMEQTVKQAGFSTVMREYLEDQFPSEIVTAIK
jgi:demethylmenaquinone methyltransferase/2-methoxy-6-polyprenyl-1,4-benzoquinol methylase